MVLLGTRRTFGRYGSSPVSATFVRDALAAFNRGVGVTATRNALRREGGYTFANDTITELFREFARLETAQVSLNQIRLDFRPGPQSLVRTPRQFSTRYFYTGRVDVWRSNLGRVETLEVNFGENRLLTRGEIIARIEAIAETSFDASRAQGSGGIGDEVVGSRLTAAMERG